MKDQRCCHQTYPNNFKFIEVVLKGSYKNVAKAGNKCSYFI